MAQLDVTTPAVPTPSNGRGNIRVHTASGPALRAPHARQTTGLHAGGAPHARARYRRQHRYLRHRQRGAAAAVAVSRARSRGPALEPLDELDEDVGVGAGARGLSAAGAL